jgi:hypothetical protein
MLPLAQLIESFVFSERITTIAEIAKELNIDESRCREELAPLAAFGIHVTQDGWVFGR